MKKLFLIPMAVFLILLNISSCEKNEIDNKLIDSKDSSQIVFRQGHIDVTPSSHNFDFGDVVIGDQASTIITITNVGNDVLTLFLYHLIGDYEGFSRGKTILPPVQLLPEAWGIPEESFLEIEINFAPSSPGYFEVTLLIESDDYIQPNIDFTISGTGVETEPPPPADPTELQDYFVNAVNTGGIEILDSGFSDNLAQTVKFYEKGKIKQACKKLHWLVERCDGEFPPPDMISGLEREQLEEYLLDLIEKLDCP